MITMTAQTVESLRAAAADARRRSAESWERSDTDGFLSQAAADTAARVYDEQARILENGGVDEFPALFDLDGNLVAAKYVKTRFGYAWGILPDDNPDGRFVAWFNESEARKGATRLANDRKKGYTVGTVKARAKADFAGWGVGVYRTDGGFSRDVEIVSTAAYYVDR